MRKAVNKTLPRYAEIAEDIERLIFSGKWPPGHRIPPEQALTRQYGCARMTVSKALASLVNAGLIERRRRVGTVVAKPGNHPAVIEVRDIKTEVIGRGAEYGYKLLSRRNIKADEDLALRMDLKVGAGLLHISALHFADGAPFAFERRWINVAEVPEAARLSFRDQSAGAWLIEHIPWTDAEHDISAMAAGAEEAKLLELPRGAACLVMERQTWRGGRAITYSRFVFPAEAHRVSARFRPSPKRSD